MGEIIMTISELCLKRESVRDYQNREIESEKLNAVLEAVSPGL